MSDVVSVALIVAFSTLIGSLGAVIITNKSADKRLHARMQHEKEEAIRERHTKVLATYLEPLRDLLYEFDFLLTDATNQMDKVAQSGDSAEMGKSLELLHNLTKAVRILSLTASKVLDNTLKSPLKDFLDLISKFLGDIQVTLAECSKSDSLTALKDINRTNANTRNKIKQRITECHKRIEELLSGCDTN